MILKLRKRVDLQIVPLSLFCLLVACNNDKTCSVSDNEKVIQEYQKSKDFFSLLQVDHGAWGEDVTLKICNNNELIEEIGLRGEDYLPTIDSVINSTVYIHYSFPRNKDTNKLELLKFEDVVLGEALIDRGKLKYKYVFYNKNKTSK